MTKSDEELKKDQQEAKEKLELMLNASKPKNLRHGVGTGINNIIAGAVGGVGVAVLAPTAGLAMGLKNGGLLGGVLGVTGGVVVGALGGVGLIAGGAISGITQMVRGVVALPEAMMAPRQGKWWNESTHCWVYTDLSKVDIPIDDEDLLSGLKSELDENGKPTTAGAGAGGKVKDTFYYDLLEVDPHAESSAIKRKYYVLARKYHPDKNPGDQEAADKFKEVAEAYQVLSDPQLREKYNLDGRDGLTGDKTGVSDDQHPDSSLLLAFLFGSDQFNDYYGRLATSTSAMLGDSPKLTLKDARTLQERRTIRLALTLAKKMDPWVLEDYEVCKVQWFTEADELAKASYGWELVQALGMAYEVAAVQFLGSLESGIGMPSISKWADAQQAGVKGKKAASKNQFSTMMASMDAIKIQMEFQVKLAEAQTEDEKVALQREMEEAIQGTMLKIIWTTTVVDITSTVYEVCQMLFHDQSVDKDIRKKRAYGVQHLGEVFQATAEPAAEEGAKKDARAMFEEAALAATLETIKRKDEATHKASFGGQ